MGVFIEPLHGRVEPVGDVFVAYAREDADEVHNRIVKALKAEGIPTFVAPTSIDGGDDWYKELDEAARRSCCGIVVLSTRSVRSRWVSYEAGLLMGRDTVLIPFLLDAGDDELLTGELPGFFKRIQAVNSVDALLKRVQSEVYQFGNLFDDPKLNKAVLPKLKQVKITVTLKCPAHYQNTVTPGYTIVRFGREEVLGHPANTPLRDEGILLNHAVFSRLVPDNDETTFKVEYMLPVHRQLGIAFKAFMDVKDLSLTGDVQKTLTEAGFEDVSASRSGEAQRVYFLLPEIGSSGLVIVKSPEGIPNNFLDPGKQNNFLFPV